MSRKRLRARRSSQHCLIWAGAVLALCLALGCVPTSHPVVPFPIGVTRSGSDMEAVIDEPGTLTVEQVNSADWKVRLSGLLNLDHPKAKAARLSNRLEPISIYFYAVRDPRRGLFLVDSGVERKLRDNPPESAVSWLARTLVHFDRLVVHTDMATFLAQEKSPVQGVFLTHLHLDHVTGLPDVPATVPIYVGKGDAARKAFVNVLARSTMNAELAGKAPLREIAFQSDPSGQFEGVLDIFGDGQLWAIDVPGHTDGSIAYVARTPAGPVLITGDTSHTAWGWIHGVEPGDFSGNQRANAVSLQRLRTLVARHPNFRVYVGHQSLPQ